MAAGAVISTVAGYLGELFLANRRPNQLLRLLGGIRGGVVETTAREFPVGVSYDLDAPSQPAILEGADAPAAAHRTLTQATNVVQIFHEKVTAAYLGQSDQTISGVVPLPQGAAQGEPINPRSSEWQVLRALEKVAQDANYSFLRGAYVNPADPSGTALKTRGLRTAVTTNVLDKTGEGASPTAAELKGFVESLIRMIIDNNGFAIDETWTCFCDAIMFNNVVAAYESAYQVPASRTVGGLQLRTIATRMGTLNLVLEPDMAADEVMVANLGPVAIVGLPVPGKGILFEEPLAKSGSADNTQIYGQLGIDHGFEWLHGVLKVKAGSVGL